MRKGRITLSAGAYVGLINAQLSVDILTRLRVGNLARVLEIARAPLGRLRRTLRTYQLAEAPQDSVLAFIAANLVDAARDIEVAGFIKQQIVLSAFSRMQVFDAALRRATAASTFARMMTMGRERSTLVVLALEEAKCKKKRHALADCEPPPC